MELLTDIERRLRIKRYSQNTIDTYIACLRAFFIHFKGRDKSKLTKEEVLDYMDTLVKKGYAKSTQNQYINAIKFYYEKCLNRDREFYLLDRPIKDKKLPVVMSKEETELMFGELHNLKHKTIMVLIYSCGLRISELLNLRIDEIDDKRMLINIRSSKGNKDRQVQLTENVLILLKKYYNYYLPQEYVINGINGGKYSSTSVQKIIKAACKRAGINKNVTPHTLRHSFATHLLEAGTDIRYIQTILGHNSIRTTEIYTHVSSSHLKNIKNPSDNMNIF